MNRQSTQPGEEFFTHSVGVIAAQMACIANATSIDDLFLRMGRVQALEPANIVFAKGNLAMEAHYPDDAGDITKNKLCGNVPFPHTLAEYPRTVMVNMMNQMQWSQDKTLRAWMHASRLDGFAKLMSSVDPSDVEKLAILGDLKAQAKAEMGNLPKLMALSP